MTNGSAFLTVREAITIAAECVRAEMTEQDLASLGMTAEDVACLILDVEPLEPPPTSAHLAGPIHREHERFDANSHSPAARHFESSAPHPTHPTCAESRSVGTLLLGGGHRHALQQTMPGPPGRTPRGGVAVKPIPRFEKNFRKGNSRARFGGFCSLRRLVGLCLEVLAGVLAGRARG